MSIITTAIGAFETVEEVISVADSVIEAAPALIQMGVATAERMQGAFDKVHATLNQIIDLPDGPDELDEALARLEAQRQVIARVRQHYAPDSKAD